MNLSMRHQVLVERCLLGWKEIEYEVMRDGANTCITVCNMENLDPMGVHTGDSIVVAPSQTLSDKEYHMLRTASLNIIRALGIEGGCNVQLALDPNSFQYYVIEVNPRVSRSSALASKATGYPIARVAAKIAIGLHLDEIENAVTKKTKACFEPALDYVVVKFPRWPFDKFVTADRRIGTQMKATGEVMAIDRTFEGALMKAIRSLEIGATGLTRRGTAALSDMQIEEGLAVATDERIFIVAEAFRRGMMVEEVAQLSSIDPWFLEKNPAIGGDGDAPAPARPRAARSGAKPVRPASGGGTASHRQRQRFSRCHAGGHRGGGRTGTASRPQGAGHRARLQDGGHCAALPSSRRKRPTTIPPTSKGDERVGGLRGTLPETVRYAPVQRPGGGTKTL
jgi:hypothetical protein